MQMPIPQKGARASRRTENRHGSLAIIIAAATLVPSATRTGWPFTVIEKPLLLIRADSSVVRFEDGSRSTRVRMSLIRSP